MSGTQLCPCKEVCPISEALRMIGGRWKLRLLCALMLDGTLRYRELQERIRGITPAMLSSSLKEMERSGLVTRTRYQEVPPRVEYSVTEKGRELWPILHRLAHWAADEPYDGDCEPGEARQMPERTAGGGD